jgi:hypothetical protein
MYFGARRKGEDEMFNIIGEGGEGDVSQGTGRALIRSDEVYIYI